MRKENSRQYITLRAIIIGMILIPLNNYWVMMTEVKWYVLQGTSIPLFVRTIFMLFLIIGLNLLLKRYFPKFALSSAELLIIYFFVVISGTFNGHDMLQNLLGSIGTLRGLLQSKTNGKHSF